MKGKRYIFFIIALLLIFSISSFAQTKKLTRIGVNTFAQVKGNIPTAQVMKTIAQTYAGDIKYGFDQVGMGNAYLPFLDQLKSATFVEKAIPVGDKFYWMLFRVRGKVKVTEDLEWAGKKSLEVFSFTVKDQSKIYEFIIPKPCGNIALYKITDVKVVAPPPAAVCNITVAPPKANINDLITVDMSGTRNASSMNVEVFNAQGTRVASHAFTPSSPRWQMKLDKPGEYVFKAKAVNEEGKASENPCQTKVAINFPPTCKLWTSCLPCEDYVGKPIVFDANGSSDPDGQIVKASFEITDEAGNVIDSFMKTEKPFVWEKIFNRAGKYNINVVVFDDMGVPSSNADPCRISFEVTQKTVSCFASIGPLWAKGSPYFPYLYARLGLLVNLIPDALDFIIRAGVPFPLKGSPWKAFVTGDLLLQLDFGRRFYWDTGIGFATKSQTDRKTVMELVFSLGVNVFKNYKNAGSIFTELRVPVIPKDIGSHQNKIALGFRYIF